MLMKCGHIGSHMLYDVASSSGKIDVMGCGYCFNDLKPVNQPACIVADVQPVKVPVEEKTDRSLLTVLILGGLAWTFVFVYLCTH